MKKNWRSLLLYDPVPPLLASGNEAIVFFTERDLLGKQRDVHTLWNLPDAQRLLRSQRGDGSWKFKGPVKDVRSLENYAQLETYRNLGYLVEMYGLNRGADAIQKAADFLFNFQTSEGDIRGIYGNQYTPNYTAGILELLVKAGYAGDLRVKKTFKWLINCRQNDGGWAIPFRTVGRKLDAIIMESATVQPVGEKPFSHLVTGVVLRAFAAHEDYRRSDVAIQAGKLLAANLFRKDKYPDRGTADYWLRFTYPFWFTDLISAMDSLSQIPELKNDTQISRAQEWFMEHQQHPGLWSDLKFLKNQQYHPHLWLSLAICRIMKRLHK